MNFLAVNYALVGSDPGEITRAPQLTATPIAVDGSTSGWAKIGMYLYLLFIVSWFAQLAVRHAFLAAIRFDLLLVIVIAVLCVLSAKDPRPAGPSWTAKRLVGWLVIYSVLTLPFTELSPSVAVAIAV